MKKDIGNKDAVNKSFMFEFERTYNFCHPLNPIESQFLCDIVTIGTKIKDQSTLKKLISDVIFKVQTIENE